MEEDLLPYKGDFYKECKIIDFFVKTLDEIKAQIEFYGYICEKEFKIFSNKAEKDLENLSNLKLNISKFKEEPSNLFLVENEIIKFLSIYYSTYKSLYPGCFKSIKSSVNSSARNLEKAKKNILANCITMLKQSLKTNNKTGLKKNIKDSMETVMIQAFKGLFNLHQLILIYSKKKNNLYLTIKNSIESNTNSEELNIVIDDVTERKYAQKYNINYEPIHFGNNLYKELLRDESTDVMELSNSYLNYTMVFIKCIQIRKKLIKEMRIFAEKLRKKNSDIIPELKKICEKITSKTKKFTHSSPGTINSWNLVFSSWNSFYMANTSYFQYFEDIFSSNLTKHIEECNEDYKSFEKNWENYAEKIKELREKYMKYNNKKHKKEENKEKIEEEKNEKKKREEKLKNYLKNDCNDFLDIYIPSLRDNAIKRINEIKELSEKIKKQIKKNIDAYLENTENEYDNAASIDLFDEIQNMFEGQLESLEINEDMETYMESIKEEISKINFNDDLADNARMSLAEYYEHNDLDDGFDFSGGEIINPFGNKIIEEDNKEYNINKDIINGKIGTLKDEELSSIIDNKNNNINIENDLDEINYLNNKMSSFREIKSKEKKRSEINELNNNQNITNNEFNNVKGKLNAEESNKINDENINKKNKKKIINPENFHKKSSLHDSKRKIDNLAGDTLCCLRGGNIDMNNDLESFNEQINDQNFDENKKDGYDDLNIKKNITFEGNIISPIYSNKDVIAQANINNEEKGIENITEFNKNLPPFDKASKIKNDINDKNIKLIQKIHRQDNTTLNYAILSIIGLFCLKSLFSSNNFFSSDSFLNIVILGVIGFIMYKTQFNK